MKAVRIYLADSADAQAARQAAVDAGFPACSICCSDHLGRYLQVAGVAPALEQELIAAIRAVDPSAGTAGFWLDDEARYC
ncbi:MAG: hypothetical protein WBP61_19730 [Nocardioides sp.]